MAERSKIYSMTQFPQTIMDVFLRGFACRCPACGKGKMFRRFLKVVDHCPNCGEDLSHHRADDMPAYLVAFIVGHVVISGVAWAEHAYQLTSLQHMLIWLPLSVVLALGLLQPIKGAIVAFQWFKGLHGFAAAKKLRDSAQ